MIDKEKIILMTQLAVYDKHGAEADRRINDYFLHDFIYKNNMWTRFSVILGSIILYFFYMLHRIFNEGLDIMTLDYIAELKKMGLFILVIAAVYTVIGSIKSSYDYRQSQKKISEYSKRLSVLTGEYDEGLEEEYEDSEEETGEGTDVGYRDDLLYTRDFD
ncbi:MAG: hypothetical protein LBS21_01965 [Clostridiales bacterium]|jgi:hypothetical protein|nr:hypothetical protein [Clostridiales bacterium]